MVKVSIAMGVYNDAEYLRSSIDSILEQTYANFEFLICDDGSNDDTFNIIQEYKIKDKRIKYIKNSENKGLAFSLNRCLEIAQGEYFARMDADDVALLERLGNQVSWLDSHKEYSIYGTSANLFDDNRIWGKRIYPSRRRTTNEIFMGESFIHPSVMIRIEDLKKVGGYTVEKRTFRTEDYDLWCKFYHNGFIGANTEEVLINYREDKDSFKKRAYKYRVNAFVIRLRWYIKLRLNWSKTVFIIKPLIVGLLPSILIREYHKNKFR